MFKQRSPECLIDLNPKRICIIKPSALGDVVQALEILPAIRLRFPKARISWVINRSLRDLLSGNPMLDEIIPFEREGSWLSYWRLLKYMRSCQFDMVLDFQGLLRSAALVWASGAPVRIGLGLAREGSSLSTNFQVSGTGLSVPPYIRYREVARQLGCRGEGEPGKIWSSLDDYNWADALLQSLPRPIFAVQPGARWETKRWPVEKFGELMSLAHQRWGGSTVILGSSDEHAEAEELRLQLARSVPSERVLNLAGQSTLKQLAALLARVNFGIGNDSGPMHVAAGVGTPTLGIFTCTSPVRSGPSDPRHELVATTIPCAASYCKKCPMKGEAHLACFRELEVERAWQGLQRLVAKNGMLAQRSRRVA